ncbi:MAG TPA: DnaD domain protein [Dehalococcoidia bacterium]
MFSGFPARAEVTPIPNLFFTAALQKITSLTELKTILHVFWLLSRRRGYPQCVTATELLADPILMAGVDSEGSEKENAVRQALREAVNHGILLQAKMDKAGQSEDIYLINTDAGRDTIEKIEQGKLPHLVLTPAPAEVRTAQLSNIFSLYERNIGMLTPLVAEQLKEAENKYPADWIEAAFAEAASLNKRSWKYIIRILERWAIEGKDDGKFGRDTEKEADREKYIRGKYGHMVKG